MIYQDDTGQETWVMCDECTLTMFGGFTPTNMIDMQNTFKAHGWTFGKRTLCPYCNAEKRGGDNP